ncbi:hypothetical protein V8E36_002805, partial [Tilletia maclaganii]
FQAAIDLMPPDVRAQYAYIPHSIRNGFSLGNFKIPSTTHLWPNQYKPDRDSSIQNWLSSSLDAGFIAGPYSKEEVEREAGSFQNSSILIVDKFDNNGKLTKERIVYNASHPRRIHGRPPPTIPSLNSQLNKQDYPCQWLLVQDVKV